MIDGEPVRRTVISIDSEKTGMRVELPLLRQLEATLDAGPLATCLHRHPAGQALGSGNRIRGGKQNRRGGREISPWQAQGPQQPGQPRMGQPNVSWRQFSDGSGGRMATLYTKSANRGRLAAGAIGKLDRAETENRTSIPAPTAEVRAGIRKSE